jgi:hypothetical protein
MRLTDGGLSSNLPSFLFETFHTKTGVRTLAFDLIEDSAVVGEPAAEQDGLAYLRSLAACAVEASDVLLRRSTAGVEYYPIPVPPGIGVLSLRIDVPTRHACFDRGFSRAAELIERAEWYVRMRLMGEGLQARLIAEHGSPDLFEPVLRALVDQLANKSADGLERPRASIALATSRASKTNRIVTYSLGMTDDPDSDFEMKATAGCSGRAWKNGTVAVADVEEGRKTPGVFEMTSTEYAKIPREVRAVISVPILGDRADFRPEMHPIGTISVDCQTPLSDTGWISESLSEGKALTVDPEIEEIL